MPHVITAATHLSLVLFDVKWNGMLSLRRFLEKLFTLHNHIHKIIQIARSRRLSPVLEGEFKVVLVPEAYSNISIKLSYQDISSVIFPPGDPSGNPSIHHFAPLIKEIAKSCTIVHNCT